MGLRLDCPATSAFSRGAALLYLRCLGSLPHTGRTVSKVQPAAFRESAVGADRGSSTLSSTWR